MNNLERFSRAGFLFPLVLLALTTVYLVATFNIRTMFGADGGVGPRTLPIITAIIMYVALLTVIVKEFKTSQEAEESRLASHVRPSLVAIATACYITLFVPLGYGISTFLFVAALFLIFKYQTRQPIAFVLYDLSITVLFYGLFAGLFDVRLPTLTGYFL